MRRSSGTGYIMRLVLNEEKLRNWLYTGVFLMEEKLRNWILDWVSFNCREVRNWLYNGVTSHGGESQEQSSKRGEKTVISISSRRPDFKDQSEEQVDILGGSACLKNKANFYGEEAQELSGEYCTFNFIGEKLRVSLEKGLILQ